MNRLVFLFKLWYNRVMNSLSIIGTTLIDITFHSNNQIKNYTCNKGSIQISLGGSMCNVASRLATCGTSCDFYTILGSDKAQEILENIPELVNIYADILDKPQPVFIQLNETMMCCSITPDFFFQESPLFDSDKLIVTDNESILKSHKNVIFSGSIPEVKHHLTGLVINESEALDSYPDIESCVQDLKSWCQWIIITRSEKGVAYYDGKDLIYADSLAGKLEYTLGCGDTFLAGFLNSYLHDESIHDCIAEGQKLVSKYYQ